MAQITFTIADEDIPRAVAAFENQYGAKQPEETTRDFVKRHTIIMLQNWIRNTEAGIARNESVNSFIDLDIT